jgi:hypothetical protein
MRQEDLDFREDLARVVLNYGEDVLELTPELAVAEPMMAFALTFASVQAARAKRPALKIPFPKGLGPTPAPIAPVPNENARLPSARTLVVTWTVDEAHALSDVLTPAYPAKTSWYKYRRNFNKYKDKISPGAPARRFSNRLGSYMPTKIGKNTVLCFKSELHMARDAVTTGDGTATLPVKDLWNQLIDEVRPSLVITAGTAGATLGDCELGDVVVSRAAQFRLKKKFAKEPFNNKKFMSTLKVPTGQLKAATKLMGKFREYLQEPLFGPPVKRYPFPKKLIKPPANSPDIKLEGKAFAKGFPILTTDYFEFGTSKNGLDKRGCAVEMGDAVLGLVMHERRLAGKTAPEWLIIRNASDPQINGDLPTERRRLERGLDMQVQWAVWYYLTFGYWTSVNSALATWAVAADF